MIFRDLSIRGKLAVLVMTASAFAVILACVGFAIYERQRFHTDVADELRHWPTRWGPIRLLLWPSTIKRARTKCWRHYAPNIMC